MQYQISIDGGSSFTSLASLDLTGAPVPPSGTTTQFHTTASETELYGLDWSGLSQADINSGNQVIFRWYINDSEPADGPYCPKPGIILIKENNVRDKRINAR